MHEDKQSNFDAHFVNPLGNKFGNVCKNLILAIIPLCKYVVAKVTLVPSSVNLTGKRDKGGHGGATINNARIIIFAKPMSHELKVLAYKKDI